MDLPSHSTTDRRSAVASLFSSERAPHARWWAAVLGLAMVAVLTGIDLALGPRYILIASIVIAPFVTALFGAPRETMVVVAAAFGSAAASAAWNHNGGDVDYLVRLAIVAVGGGFALGSAHSRVLLCRDRQRFELLLALGAASEEPSLDAGAVARLAALVVPAVADICVIDVLGEHGRAQRLTVVVDPAHGPRLAERLRAGTPSEIMGQPLAALVERPRLAAFGLAESPEPGGPAEVALRSAVRVPLRARGRRIGAMVLATTDASLRRFTAQDLAFADVLGARVALALDNAGLLTELELVEAQRTAALEALAEAVIVQDASGDWVYVNAAAVRLMGFASAQEVLATPRREILARFTTRHEDGRPLDDLDRPGRKVFEGGSLEPVLVWVVESVSGAEYWWILKASAITDASGQPVLAVNVIEDVTEVKRAEVAQRFLARAGEVLGSSLDDEETLRQVARLAVPQLADWCAIRMPDAQGDLRSVALAHAAPDTVAVPAARDGAPVMHLGADDAERALRDGVTQVFNDVGAALLEAWARDPAERDALRALEIRAVMHVPMIGPRGVIGTLCLVSAESGRTFSERDRRLAEELGRQAGTAVEHARLYTERSHIALTLQASLLPDTLPEIPGLRLAALYRPTGQESFVGGDFFDAVETTSGWTLFIGDVTGRGVEAAALTGRARHTLRTAARMLGDPVATVQELNRSLADQRELDLCTVAVVAITEEADGHTAAITCAGHPPPLLVRDGRATEVGAPGPMVGAWEGSAWTSTTIALEAGDLLVLFTDGVTDAVGEAGRFGGERLAAVLGSATDADDAIVRLRTALEDFEHGPQADDNAALVVEVPAADGEQRRRAAQRPLVVQPPRSASS